MEDITPELLSEIEKEFDSAMKNNRKITELYEKVRDGTATYREANDFAIEVGESLAAAFKRSLSSDVLPDGKMYYNIANRIIPETLQHNYELISEAATQVQEALNSHAGISIKAIKPELNTDRINGLVEKVSDAERYDEVAWVLDEPVVNFSQSIVDDYIRKNADFQGKAGMRPKVIRTAVGKGCEWCQKMAGTYDYPNVPHDIYRRHERCRCTVEYEPGSGKRQNVHTKEWKSAGEYDKIEKRKKIRAGHQNAESPKAREARIDQENALGLAEQISAHPKMLQSYTPDKLKELLEKNGYEVKPLGQGKLKNIPFEDGGGYRVHYGGDGILQYHPEKKSHHGGAYYKISTGKGGKHRYDTKGEEKTDD